MICDMLTLPEKQPHGDYLGVLDEDDNNRDDYSSRYHDFRFHDSVLRTPHP